MQIELNVDPSAGINGEVHLVSSKSESNRLLILKAVTGLPIELINLSDAEDTSVLRNILSEFLSGNKKAVYDVGAAGSTFRFLTAFFASRDCSVILTGDQRMKHRPVGELVEALRTLGSDIDYLDREGFPPLQIRGRELAGGFASIPADVSSQFISALMMVAPSFRNGLKLQLSSSPVSFPYISMTARWMQKFGIDLHLEKNLVTVKKRNETSSFFSPTISVSGDWSAASYFYSFVALSESSEISLLGLQQESGQADEIVVKLFQRFGVESLFMNDFLRIKKSKSTDINYFEFDFTDCPDIAQTIAVVCSAKKIRARLTGLQTLRKKETDRIEALQKELVKFGVQTFAEENELRIDPSKADFKNQGILIGTYSDHRMAMSFAPLVLLTQTLTIESPSVVKKSFPLFWSSLEEIGIKTKMM